MLNNLKFAIMALVCIGLIKLIQVTAFDADKYKKAKENSFIKYTDGKDEAKKSKAEISKPATKKPKESEKPTPATESQTKAKSDQVPKQSKEQSTPAESNKELVSLSDLKNNYLAPKLAELPTGQLREDVVIRYYRHEKDGDKIYTLRELGYYIHEKEATETAGMGSNVIYYGDQVNKEDIQIVAYTLLEKGIPLKSIQKTQFDWKFNSIEIGTDSLLIDDQTLQTTDIERFSKN